MIAPIAGFAMRGALWYQGEGNCRGEEDDASYADKIVTPVGGWRKWQEGDYAVYLVLIARTDTLNRNRPASPRRYCPSSGPFDRRRRNGSKILRMVVTTDLVNDLGDIHPRDKQRVGHRLALLARNKTYGEKKVVCSGLSRRE